MPIRCFAFKVSAIPGHDSASGWFFPFWTYITGGLVRFPVQLAAMARWGFWLVSSGVVRCGPLLSGVTRGGPVCSGIL